MVAIKEAGKNILFGAVIGASMLLPGVSGGTTAVMLGIYDRLIGAVSNVCKTPKQSLPLLAEVACGGALGALLLAKGVLRATELFFFPMRFLFMGLILGSVPMLVKQSGFTVKKSPLLLFAALGVFTAAGLSVLPPLRTGGMGALGPVLCGLPIAVALVLPGVSTSHLLLTLGLYDPVLGAVSRMELPFLALLGGGTILGIFLSARVLEAAMTRFPTACYLLITGFVMASVYELYPGIPSGNDLPPCLLCFAAGFSGMVLLTFLKDRKDLPKKTKTGL